MPLLVFSFSLSRALNGLECPYKLLSLHGIIIIHLLSCCNVGIWKLFLFDKPRNLHVTRFITFVGFSGWRKIINTHKMVSIAIL